MLNKLKPTIGIIDSGMGGISVLNQLISRYKAGNYIYYADNLNMPYGNMNKTKLKARLFEIIKQLKAFEVDLIIVACNTASSVLCNENIPDVYLMNFDKEHTYLATPLTKKMLADFSVIADHKLAKQIEDNIYNAKKLDLLIKEHVKTYKLNKLKSFVLACTHYELVEDLFKKHCQNSIIKCNSTAVVDNINLDFKQEDITVHILLSKPNFSYYLKIWSLIKQ